MPFEKSYPSDLHVLATEPACRHLRSKGMYITGQRDPADDPYGVGDGHCWCNLSQGPMGPDGAFVDRPHCSQLRPCYERPV